MVMEAARAQKAAAMKIMMTGTPSENGLIDLWTIMDIAWPGRLGCSAYEFRRRYIKNPNADLDELRKLLIQPANDNGVKVPALMLRRMKEEILSLPPKEFERVKEVMPEIQAVAYTRAVTTDRAKGGALNALQAIRNISLHPNLRAKIDYSDPKSIGAFINMSARMKSAFRILDEISERNERALLFVDLLDAQDVLTAIIQRRYGLDYPPEVINGNTSQEKRESIRKGFELREGFEVLLLGPKAAGFGLNLVSANHVIHLNRWWNPAIEDQCTDRVYRIGQKNDVKVWLPIAVHPEYGDRSYDIILDNLLERKRKTSRDVVIPVNFDLKDLSGLHDEVFGRGGNSRLAKILAGMDYKRFEQWVIDQLIEAGFLVNGTIPSGDAGADAIVRLKNESSKSALVQVKHRSKGREGVLSYREVADVLRARGRYDGLEEAAFVLVTNASVDQSGFKVAKKRGVSIIDYTEIDRLGEIMKSILGV